MKHYEILKFEEVLIWNIYSGTKEHNLQRSLHQASAAVWDLRPSGGLRSEDWLTYQFPLCNTSEEQLSTFQPVRQDRPEAHVTILMFPSRSLPTFCAFSVNWIFLTSCTADLPVWYPSFWFVASMGGKIAVELASLLYATADGAALPAHHQLTIASCNCKWSSTACTSPTDHCFM